MIHHIQGILSEITSQFTSKKPWRPEDSGMKLFKVTKKKERNIATKNSITSKDIFQKN